MNFRVLSHAGLQISSGETSVVFDPWLLGSTYWRSWWNYPEPSRELVDSLRPDCIYLTHVHWDHFASPSLKKFDRSTLVVVPREPTGRMVRDLRSIGFSNIAELSWAESIEVGSIKLTCYPFGVFTDSAVVVEADGETLLNANDAKLMGPPLKAVTRRHPAIQFVLRSHSSANSRVMYSVSDEEAADAGPADLETVADREKYIRDFLDFSVSVGARYAIPFASNHCHLHRDVFDMNQYICTPAEVLDYFARAKVDSPEVKVMVSGDSWNSALGFDCQPPDHFVDRDRKLLAYQARVADKLEGTYRRESNARFNEVQANRYFERLFDVLPFVVRWFFRGEPLLYILEAGESKTLLEVDIWSKKIRVVEECSPTRHRMKIYTNLHLFRHCMADNLFSHLAISKRVRFECTSANFRRLRVWAYVLNFYEYGMLPVSRVANKRFLGEWLRRWREVLLYFQIACRGVLGRTFRYSDYLPVNRKV